MPTTIGDIANQCPEQFGWRIWIAQEDTGHLMSPFKGEIVESVVVEASCPHGSVLPSPECLCGIYYVAELPRFITGVERTIASYPITHRRAAYTYGYASGDVDIDPEPWDDPRTPTAFRTDRYLIQGVVLPLGSAWGQRISKRYDIPVMYGLDWKKPQLTHRRCTQLMDKIHRTVILDEVPQ